MPLKNWETLSGPSASKEEMITKIGLVPRPLVSTYLKSYESLVLEFESLEPSDGLTPEEYEIVANVVLPFALNEMIDLFEYPLIATLTNDKLTNNIKTVNNDSLDKDADTLNEQYIKEILKQVVEKEKNRA